MELELPFRPNKRATTASGIEPGLGRQPLLLVNRRFLINIGLFKTRNRKNKLLSYFLLHQSKALLPKFSTIL
nr:MAG TPA: hypothetical protein [Caudoviricetes sp.]